MKAVIRRIIQILDNTPAEYAPKRGQRQSGQSVVELALITPILIVMFAGLVEVGWFANNYLTILDVTRAGARRARRAVAHAGKSGACAIRLRPHRL